MQEREIGHAGAPRIQTQNTHGTGCIFSDSIAASLAKQMGLKCAVMIAHHYLHCVIKSGGGLEIGSGNGPVDHFFMLFSWDD